jgi:hypothetical protein
MPRSATSRRLPERALGQAIRAACAAVGALAVAAAPAPAWGLLAPGLRALPPPPPEPPPADGRRAEIDVEVSTLGRVTYGDLRAEVPVTPRLALVPAVELLHLAPVASDPQGHMHPELGVGLALEAPDHWDFELRAMYGPLASRLTTLGAAADVGTRAGPVDLDASVTVMRFIFSNVPRVAPVTQLYVEGSAAGEIADDLELRGRGMVFAYDRSLAPRTPAAVDAMSVLSRVGTYAPRWLAGARLTWSANKELAPLLGVDALGYADGVGKGVQARVGVRIDFGPRLRLTLATGLLHNWLTGAARALPDPRTVPLIRASCEIDL